MGVVDAFTYGERLSSGKYFPGAYRGPGTAMFFLPFYLFGATEFSMYLMGTLCFALMAPALPLSAFVIAESISTTAATLAYMLMLTHANLHFNAASVMSDLPFAAYVAMCNLWFIVTLRSKESRCKVRSWVFFGVLLGLSALTRPTGLYWSAGLFGLLVVYFLRSPRTIKYCSIAVFSMLLVISPWLIRNKLQFNEMSMESIKGYALFWSIGDKISHTATDTQDIKTFKDHVIRYKGTRYLQYFYKGYDYTLMHQFGRSKDFWAISRQYVLTHPIEFSHTWFKNFKNIYVTQLHYDEWLTAFLASGASQKIESNVQFSRYRERITHVDWELKRLASYLIWIFPLGLIILYLSNWKIALVQTWTLLSIPGLTAIVSGYDRFRLPIDPIICACAAIALVWPIQMIYRLLSRKKRSLERETRLELATTSLEG